MIKSILLLICLITSSYMFASDSLDIKYVWAIHGLNIRTLPNIKSKVITTLSFGDSVTILELTEIRYTIKPFEPYNSTPPLFLKSNWVKINYDSIVGYVVAAYLLEIPCPGKRESRINYTRRMAGQFGSSNLSYKLKIDGGELIFEGQQCDFPNGDKLDFITEKEEKEFLSKMKNEEGEEGFFETTYLKGFSLSEVIIFLNAFYQVMESSNFYMELSYKLVRNTPNWIMISDISTQEISIYLYKNQEIIITYQNSGC